jgi:hypothetical protein
MIVENKVHINEKQNRIFRILVTVIEQSHSSYCQISVRINKTGYLGSCNDMIKQQLIKF